MAINKQEHLANVLETHRMYHIYDLIEKFKTKRDEVKSAILSKYGANIYSPFDSGSFKKHTAINSKFDLDIVVPFKRNSSDTLESMFNELYDFLYEEYSDVATVRKQKVSIGIAFDEDDEGDIVDLDIVPGRELNQDQYVDDKNLNLYVYEKYGFFDKSTYIQTNIQSQIDHITAKENERKIIRLLKIWKNSNGESFKSFLLELFAIKAFEKEEINGNLWEKLEGVMKYIRDNVTKKDFKLIDPGNSNNDVMETLDEWGRNDLESRMSTILDRINDNDENIKTYFPVNEEFDKEDKSTANGGYGIKGGAVTPSIPPSTQRFG